MVLCWHTRKVVNQRKANRNAKKQQKHCIKRPHVCSVTAVKTSENKIVFIRHINSQEQLWLFELHLRRAAVFGALLYFLGCSYFFNYCFRKPGKANGFTSLTLLC